MSVPVATNTICGNFPATLLRLRRWVNALKENTARWRERRRYRADLERLLRAGDYLVKDIGLTPEDAHREINKPFWKT